MLGVVMIFHEIPHPLVAFITRFYAAVILRGFAVRFLPVAKLRPLSQCNVWIKNAHHIYRTEKIEHFFLKK